MLPYFLTLYVCVVFLLSFFGYVLFLLCLGVLFFVYFFAMFFMLFVLSCFNVNGLVMGEWETTRVLCCRWWNV